MLSIFRKIIGCVLMGLLAWPAVAQDVHFSQYNSAPLFLNPALTGVNGCNYRLVANYRNQWQELAPYRTFAGSYDMTLGKMGKSNFAGIGAFFYSDKAGDSKLTTNNFNISASYSVMLNKKASQYFTTGLYGGLTQRSFDPTQLTFDSQFGPEGYDPNLPTQEDLSNNKKMFPDVGMGFLYNYTEKQTNFYMGAAVSHLNQPNQSFLNELDEKLYMRWTLHGGGHFQLSDKLFALPSFMILAQGPFTEYNVGTLIKYKTKAMPKDKTAVYFGAFYRVKDALIFATRVDIASFNIGISYDFNLSKLTPASAGRGGAELSLIYTGCFQNSRTVSYCPLL